MQQRLTMGHPFAAKGLKAHFQPRVLSRSGCLWLTIWIDRFGLRQFSTSYPTARSQLSRRAIISVGGLVPGRRSTLPEIAP